MSPIDHEHEEQSQRMRDAVDRKAEEARARAEEQSMDATARTQDTADPRAKNTGHKKKTADKWNQ